MAAASPATCGWRSTPRSCSPPTTTSTTGPRSRRSPRVTCGWWGSASTTIAAWWTRSSTGSASTRSRARQDPASRASRGVAGAPGEAGASEPFRRVGDVVLLEPAQVVVAEPQVDRCHGIGEVLRPGHPDDRGCHRRSLEQPGERDLGAWDPVLVGDGGDRLHDLAVGLLRLPVQGAGEPVGLAAPGRDAPVAGETSTRERAPRHHADALVEAERVHLPLLFPHEQVVVVLH